MVIFRRVIGYRSCCQQVVIMMQGLAVGLSAQAALVDKQLSYSRFT